ncbi:16244_t:CDS:2 [Acaulospora colombiana]|uniref:16244_t:CDS:1 n=1 Tax=Acaulospora colombiana TaxID=27376 RepID=A0ACA9KWB6_9GLOM|nr:16244_t:CDS:2 [Acaulospora colombiana]
MSKFMGPERRKFEDTLLKEIDKVPLFMTELPEEESESLAALQSLLYDGSPEEIAENFKKQGNECFKEGKTRYQDAITYYTKALETNCKDNKIIEACLANRAAVNLELGNFRKVLTDCAKVIRSNPMNVKAFYRSAKALCELEKMKEAIDCCDHGLKTRNINMETTNVAHTSPHSVHLNPEGQLIWPVVFLYPEYQETDFIAEFNEGNTFQDHLDVMFENPAPWDTLHKYTPDKVQIYYEYIWTTGNEVKPKLLKIGKNCILKEVLSHQKYVVKNGIPNFIVLSNEGEFKEEFLSRYK